MRPLPPALVPDALFQHWKGGLYRIVAVPVDEGCGEPVVVYRPLADPSGRCWSRPLPVFIESVTGLDGSPRARFEPVPLPGDAALRSACTAADVPVDLVDAALARYREPQRAYPANWHVHDVFERALAHGARPSRAQALAMLFHDLVHVPGAPAGANETLSALLLRQAAYGHDALPVAEVEQACTMIADTATHRPSVDGSIAVIAADLAALGDDPVRFDAWTELAWLEHRFLFGTETDPRAAFLERRTQALRTLVDTTRDLALPDGLHGRIVRNLERLERRHGG